MTALATMAQPAHRFYAVDATGADVSGQVTHSIVCDTSCRVQTVTLTLRNDGRLPFQPVRAGLKLGIDTYMDTYPAWRDKFFPTLAVCEPTHFYGYMQSPGGGIKVLASADPVASWSLDYNMGYQDPPGYWFYGHRIEGLNLDVLCRGPLPARHPQLWQLSPGEERSWTLKIIDIDRLDDFEPTVHAHTGVPMIAMERTSCSPGDIIGIDIYGYDPTLSVEGNRIGLRKTGDNLWHGEYRATAPGLKGIEVSDGRCSAAGHIAVRRPWLVTMDAARRSVVRYKQKATSHVESWYGFHTAFDMAALLPDTTLDSALDARFDMIIDKVFDRNTGRPYKYDFRIQNVSSTIGMLADRFAAFGRGEDLDLAARMADYLMSCQRSDGAYMNGNTDYTSVIYPAKSLLELADAERAAGRRKAAKLHEESARRAISRLADIDGDFQTEGQHTYEDGMVSCSALQLGEMALRSKRHTERERYARAMLKQLREHSCLTQLRVPDGRRRGGTLRFWEAQYDVFLYANLLSSPHGWSAWRAYATYYAYLLTGDEEWLRQTFDAAAAFAQLIDPESGDLQWAFAVDPRIEAVQVSAPDSTFTADDDTYGNPHPLLYPHRTVVVGNEYLPMISDWQTIVSSDNDVYECFKFIAEAVLCNAFVVERPDGSIAAYNCTARMTPAGALQVEATEPQITTLYTNLNTQRPIHFDGEIKTVSRTCYE